MSHRFAKDPDSLIDYQIDWTAWLDGDTIATSAWMATAGITIDSDTNTNTVATVWLSGGTLGERYEVTNRIVTTAGREDERSLFVRIEAR
jgi:hypothetical protein